MPNGKLRVGVIGTGFGVAVHIPAFREEGWDVTAICARTPGKVRKAADDLGIAHAFTDYRELVASPDVDVVCVVTPPVSHAEQALAAIDAGKHVLCEKPFAMNIEQARGMRDAAKTKGVTAMVAHEFRYTPQRLQAKALLDDGYVGRVTTVYAQANFALGRGKGPSPMQWQANLADGGGQLGAIGSHFLDSIRWWAGDITEISATLATLRPERVDASGNVVMADAEDSFVIHMRFANGALGSLAYTSASPVMQGARTVIEGTDGVLVLPQAGVNPTSAEVVHGAKAGEEIAPIPRPADLDPLPETTDRRIPAFRRLVRDFQRSVAGGTSLSPNFDDGMAVQAILDAVRESSVTSRTIKVSS